MKEIALSEVTAAVKDLCMSASVQLSCDMENAVVKAQKIEKSPLGQSIMKMLEENIRVSRETGVPLCQDTGMAVVFCEIGQEVHFTGGNFQDAVEEGVRQGYREGCLRCSVVADPLRRKNTGDNTPPVLHVCLVPGDKVKITVAPKGFGSENMSAIRMFNPTATLDEIIAFVVDTIKKAGSKPCPPIVVGIGIGGTFEYCALLSKKALSRDIEKKNPDAFYSELEERLLKAINNTGIGPQGFGGTVTALAVNVEHYATHIAGLPVAVNIGCHVTRHATKTI